MGQPPTHFHLLGHLCCPLAAAAGSLQTSAVVCQRPTLSVLGRLFCGSSRARPVPAPVCSPWWRARSRVGWGGVGTAPGAPPGGHTGLQGRTSAHVDPRSRSRVPGSYPAGGAEEGGVTHPAVCLAKQFVGVGGILAPDPHSALSPQDSR